MSVFKYHVFCCTTSRPPQAPHPSCGPAGTQDLAAYLKEKVFDAELDGVRINPSSCLGMCDKGPAMVIYPEGTWYKFSSKEDMDEIFETHIKGGNKVERLLIQT